MTLLLTKTRSTAETDLNLLSGTSGGDQSLTGAGEDVEDGTPQASADLLGSDLGQSTGSGVEAPDAVGQEHGEELAPNVGAVGGTAAPGFGKSGSE